MWRSLVARMHGVHEVAGSNPVIPTKYEKPVILVIKGFMGFLFLVQKTAFFIEQEPLDTSVW